MQQALVEHPGEVVVECRSGMIRDECVHENEIAAAIGRKDFRAMPGIINYEVPAHEPLTAEGIAALRRVRKTPDATALMFSEAEMRGERR